MSTGLFFFFCLVRIASMINMEGNKYLFRSKEGKKGATDGWGGRGRGVADRYKERRI